MTGVGGMLRQHGRGMKTRHIVIILLYVGMALFVIRNHFWIDMEVTSLPESCSYQLAKEEFLLDLSDCPGRISSNVYNDHGRCVNVIIFSFNEIDYPAISGKSIFKRIPEWKVSDLTYHTEYGCPKSKRIDKVYRGFPAEDGSIVTYIFTKNNLFGRYLYMETQHPIGGTS